MSTDLGLLKTVFETIAPGFYNGKYSGFTIMMNKDGFVNATPLLIHRERKTKTDVNEWLSNDRTIRLINALKNAPGFTGATVVVIKTGKKCTHGTYIHPLLVSSFASWVSPELDLKIAQIANDFLVREACEERDKQIREQRIILGEKEDTITQLRREMKENFEKLHSSNKELISKNDILLTRNDELLSEIKNVNDSNEVLLNDVESLNTTVDKIANKLDIATDDRVVRPKCNGDMQIYAMFSNAKRTEYRIVRRQLRTFNVAKKNLAADGFNIEILKLEPSPNPINLHIRVKDQLSKKPGIMKINFNTIIIDNKKMTEATLLALIRAIDTEKKNIDE